MEEYNWKNQWILLNWTKRLFPSVLYDEESDEKAYWQSKTPMQRLEAMEMMRQIHYGYDPTTARLQRFFEVAEREVK